MAEEEKRLRIVDYQPTPEEVEMLKEAGITAAEALQYDQPTPKQWEQLQTLGYGLIEVILRNPLKGCIKDTLHQVWSLTNPDFPQEDDIEATIQEAQAHAVEVITSFLSGNPFPGKGFSMAQGEQVLDVIKGQRWNNSNLLGCLTEAKSMLEPPKPAPQAKQGKP